MKVKHILIVFAFSAVLVIIASLFKILHFAGATQLLTVSMGMSALSWALAIWKLATTKDFKSFLNK